MEALDGIGSVCVLSQVCRDWRCVVFDHPWTFEGYLTSEWVDVFPNLLPPSAFFLLSLADVSSRMTFRRGRVITPISPDLQTIVEWVVANRVKKLRLHLTFDSTKRLVKMIDLFHLFLQHGVEDLLIRNQKADPWHQTPANGLWYQKNWACSEVSGSGRLVVSGHRKNIPELVKLLSPVHLVVGNPYDHEYIPLDDMPPSVKILGVYPSFVLSNIGFQSHLQEIRIIDSNPLNPYTEERYGVCPEIQTKDSEDPNHLNRSNQSPQHQDDILISPSLRRFRGAILFGEVSRFFQMFPSVPEVLVSYNSPSLKRGTLIPFLRDSRVRTLIPTTNPRTFWSEVPYNVFQTIVFYLSFRDTLRLTQVFGIRDKIREVRVPEISASMYHRLRVRDIPFYGLMIVSRKEDLGALDRLTPNYKRLQVAGSQKFITTFLEYFEEKLPTFLTGYRAFRELHVAFSRIPAASIHATPEGISISLPTQYQEWGERFSLLRIPKNPNLDSRTSCNFLIPQCNFFEWES